MSNKNKTNEMNKNQKNVTSRTVTNKPLPTLVPSLAPDNLPRRNLSLLPASPVLRFSPSAWAKLLFLRDMGNTEIGGFAITSPEDLLRVEEIVTVKQLVTDVSVCFDDDAVADFFDQQLDLGRKPQQFLRIWTHTHPGNSASPSTTDEETFARVFGNCDWAVMFILARGGRTSARLRFNVGPGGQVSIPVEVDYKQPFPASDHDAWRAEYQANVLPDVPLPMDGCSPFDPFDRDPFYLNPYDWTDQELTLEDLPPWDTAHTANPYKNGSPPKSRKSLRRPLPVVLGLEWPLHPN